MFKHFRNILLFTLLFSGPVMAQSIEGLKDIVSIQQEKILRMEDNIKKLFEVDSKKIPSSIPIFPLDNVLLLPFGKLPLNIFEERYIIDTIKIPQISTNNILP